MARPSGRFSRLQHVTILSKLWGFEQIVTASEREKLAHATSSRQRREGSAKLLDIHESNGRFALPGTSRDGICHHDLFSRSR